MGVAWVPRRAGVWDALLYFGKARGVGVRFRESIVWEGAAAGDYGTRFRESGSEAARKTARGKRCPQRRRTLCVDCGLSDGRPQRLSINFNVDVRCISLRVRDGPRTSPVRP